MVVVVVHMVFLSFAVVVVVIVAVAVAVFGWFRRRRESSPVQTHSPSSNTVRSNATTPLQTPTKKYKCHVATKDTCTVTEHTCPSFSKPRAVGWLLMRDSGDDDGNDGGEKEAKCTQLINEDGCNQYTCYTPVFATKEECEATCLV